MKKLFIMCFVLAVLAGCNSKQAEKETDMQKKVSQFAGFTLTSNINDLSENDKQMLLLFFDVARIMDTLFWEQAYGSRLEAIRLANGDTLKEKFIEINYGPWERLNNNISFVAGIGEKPAGANFYPCDISKEEFDNFDTPDKTSLYTIIRRDENRNLVSIPYHVYYKSQLDSASQLLKKAALLASDEGLKKYLELRAEALVTSNYLHSDLAWMDMKSNRIDLVVGPIENYEDQLFGYKASFEAYILLKDMEWSKKLERYATLLPDLQKRLPVDEKYKTGTPGASSDLGAYDVVYYAGDCNAGSKTIAINLPNDPEVHKQKGSRRLQLKNAMQAKFDKILVPISNLVISPEQQQFVSFEAFFSNTMFHEVAHGLGVYQVVDDTLSISAALKDKYTTIEEGKADILGLFLEDELIRLNELGADIRESYTTFVAGIFRSIRFGAASAHGKANLISYNYLLEKGAFNRNRKGIYTVDYDKMKAAVSMLAKEIIELQGNGNYEAAVSFIDSYSKFKPELKADIEKINNMEIPVDIVFNQGPAYIGL
ncbi:MAG: Zn-dependent hydrolase [Bacteroidales bacterium]|nr:Zn-dependent hydrolase [Bacteroidales bacterium]